MISSGSLYVICLVRKDLSVKKGSIETFFLFNIYFFEYRISTNQFGVY